MVCRMVHECMNTQKGKEAGRGERNRKKDRQIWD